MVTPKDQTSLADEKTPSLSDSGLIHRMGSDAAPDMR
jgi:hypothetical protein